MSLSSVANLKDAVSKLQAERLAHQKAVAEIDAVFDELGLNVSMPTRPGKRKPGRPKGTGSVARKKPGLKKAKSIAAKKPKTRNAGARRKYAVSGQQLVLNVVKAGGKDGAKTSAIVKAWEKQGRGGAAYNAIKVLIQAKKIKRTELKDARGSVYRLA